MALLTCLNFSFIDIDALTCKNDIPDGLQAGQVAVSFLISKSALSHFHSVIFVYEYGYAFDVSLEGLVAA
jgi:hypothetical protein